MAYQNPDSQINSLAAQIDAIQLGYNLGNKYAYDPWGGYVTKAALNSIMEYSYEAVYNEVELFPACRLIVGRATQRLTLGDSPGGHPLCQDQDFVTSYYGVLDGMLYAADYLAGTRKALWPVFAPWASRPMSKKIINLKTRLKPLYEEKPPSRPSSQPPRATSGFPTEGTRVTYDLEFPESYNKQRPQNTWFAEFGIPPLDAEIRVRRRKV
ncbi:hypothetical protein E0Z10_g365 [Xylaria hypoxylon]|uniref:Uncharacterized protein n=1 Tax=Xylaria hypoxylon TaxID=37992 RepID=A0A4Z0ZBL8_9PEZI|nr:hypothetical protein E0Z10_g365 [Xylaria hypoxylon]